MTWSAQQERAISLFQDWLLRPTKPIFRLEGYAGTGKTTLARHLGQLAGGRIYFCAYTGKAAHVLMSKGCAPSRTIHSLIYKAREKSKSYLIELEDQLVRLTQAVEAEGKNSEVDPQIQGIRKKIVEEREKAHRPSFILNPFSEIRGSRLIIVDEMSMVSPTLAEDLLSFQIPVLALGDPAQLPPVKDKSYCLTSGEADITLTEIHRQAQDSPIIKMASMLRQQQSLKLGDYGDGCEVITADELRRRGDFALEADQLIVGKNKTRWAFNQRVREKLGAEGQLPEPGDKIVCLRNNHEMGLLNGALYIVKRIHGVLDRKVFMDIEPEEGGPLIEVSCHDHDFLGRKDELHWTERADAEEFDYGYALTTHKSQGSQWDHVIVYDESGVFRADRWRWAYTAATRAAKRLTWVLP